MKVLLDEGVPKTLARALPNHEVSTVPAMGWNGIKNGRLLRLIEGGGFEVFLTADQNMEAQQKLAGRPFAVLIMTAVNWPVVRPHVAAIAEAVDFAETGTVRRVDCGRFIPAKFRKRDPSI